MRVTVIKSNRKTVGIRVNPDLSVTLRVPLRMSKKKINEILSESEGWILKHINLIKKEKLAKGREKIDYLSEAELLELKDKAKQVIPGRVEYFARLMGVRYGRITIRQQKTRWGSCSSLGNLNFNCLLMLMPGSVVDYVVVHELSHLKQMNHSKAFWHEVEKIMPEYKAQYKWLIKNGSGIMRRIPR